MQNNDTEVHACNLKSANTYVQTINGCMHAI